MTPYPVIIGIAAFVLVAGVRVTSANRLIRRKLTFSLVMFAGFVALMLVRLYAVHAIIPGFDQTAVAARKDLEERLVSIAHLVFALGGINALVTLLLNPFRTDRIPDVFPGIVQDAIIIGTFMLVGIFLLGEKWLTLSAVGGFVIGFALQDTLGNMFAGLAIQVEKPFRVGQWIAVARHEGLVTEITWRATRLRTKTGDSIVVPNNILSKEAIINFSEPTPATRLLVEVGASYAAAPNEVKAVIGGAMSNLSLVLKTPAPEVVVVDFGSSAITYRVKFWIDDYARDDLARDQVRTAIYYAFKRAHIEIPFPVQVQYQREEPVGRSEQHAAVLDRIVASLDVFVPLPATDRSALVAASAERLYGAGEPIVRQGEAGESMFVICTGEVRVTLEPTGQEVARIDTGGYFGEMSLLTGEPRTATVSAVDDVTVLEITADSFRRLASVHPAVVEQISLEVARRREGLERGREMAAVGTAVVPEARVSFLARVRNFLGFSS